MTIWILLLGTLVLSLMATARVRSVYARYNRGTVFSGVTGAEAAAIILRHAGIRDVEIAQHDEPLGDHYDPLRKRLVLSSANFSGSSPAALGVAAHECGHAIQHHRAYAPLKLRMAAVGATTFASQAVMWIPLLGVATGLIAPLVGLTVVAAAWGVIMLFNLVTLPVEYDASRRAKAVLADLGLVAPGAESLAVRRVLDAAALTYVAAFITSLVYFLLYALPLLTGRRG